MNCMKPDGSTTLSGVVPPKIKVNGAVFFQATLFVATETINFPRRYVKQHDGGQLSNPQSMVTNMSTQTLPLYPDIEIQLSGEDGNAYAIIGRVRKAMRKAGLPNETIESFTAEATRGNYDALLATVMRYVHAN